MPHTVVVEPHIAGIIDGFVGSLYHEAPVERIELEARWPNEFRGSRWFFGKLRFERNDVGVVTGFRLDGSRVLNLGFSKL